MQTDTIFRIASMTKPDHQRRRDDAARKGKLLLTDPVSKFIPAFKGQRVIAEGGTTVPARREITIRDLLSHRSGLSYGFLNGGAGRQRLSQGGRDRRFDDDVDDAARRASTSSRRSR